MTLLLCNNIFLFSLSERNKLPACVPDFSTNQLDFTVYNILWSQICAVASTKVKSKAAACTVPLLLFVYLCVCLCMFFFLLVGSLLRDWESQESVILAIRDFSAHTFMHKHTHTHVRAHSYRLAQWTIMMWCVCMCADEGIPVLPWQR